MWENIDGMITAWLHACSVLLWCSPRLLLRASDACKGRCLPLRAVLGWYATGKRKHSSKIMRSVSRSWVNPCFSKRYILDCCFGSEVVEAFALEQAQLLLTRVYQRASEGLHVTVGVSVASPFLYLTAWFPQHGRFRSPVGGSAAASVASQ